MIITPTITGVELMVHGVPFVVEHHQVVYAPSDDKVREFAIPGFEPYTTTVRARGTAIADADGNILQIRKRTRVRSVDGARCPIAMEFAIIYNGQLIGTVRRSDIRVLQGL